MNNFRCTVLNIQIYVLYSIESAISFLELKKGVFESIFYNFVGVDSLFISNSNRMEEIVIGAVKNNFH